MISCRDLVREMSDYLDDDVAADLRRQIESHLTECSTCRVLYDSTRKTIRIVTEIGAFDLPDGVTGRLLARLRDELGPSSPTDDDMTS